VRLGKRLLDCSRRCRGVQLNAPTIASLVSKISGGTMVFELLSWLGNASGWAY
jgi:hypothetical protein